MAATVNGVEHQTKDQVNGQAGAAAPKTNGTDPYGPDSPLPEVPDIDSKSYSDEDALVEDIIQGMRVAGGCIVRHLIDPEVLDKIDKDVHPLLEAAQPWKGKSIFLVLSHTLQTHILWQEASGRPRTATPWAYWVNPSNTH